jgi:hypothetical protein
MKSQNQQIELLGFEFGALCHFECVDLVVFEHDCQNSIDLNDIDCLNYFCHLILILAENAFDREKKQL